MESDMETVAIENGSANGSDLQVVSFSVGQEEYGVDILRVQEIIRTRHLTRVPTLPDYVDGVINLRGKVIPVVALRRKLGMDATKDDQRTRIVVVEVCGQVLGFVVDAVSKVLRVGAETVEPPPQLGAVSREYMNGIARFEERLLLLLDLERLMDGEAQQLTAAVQ
jgi:purine-binding chemotaxis protein CheW